MRPATDEPMDARGRSVAVRAARALGWGTVFFVCAQIALNLNIDRRQPELRDPEYGHKLTRLRRQIAENPGRPLVVGIGSSRMAMGLRPEALASCGATGGPEPLVFNAALVGSAPLMELVCLHRLLADGIRPDWVLVECWPPFWDSESANAEEKRLLVNRLTWSELLLVSQHLPQPGQAVRDWGQQRLAPWFSGRFSLLSHYAPGWLPWESRASEWTWQNLTASGWLPSRPAHVEDEERARRTESHRQMFGPVLGDFHFARSADHALRALLEVCRHENIRVALLYMPETADLQSWYPPPLRARLDGYLDRLSQEYDAPLIDARCWVKDADFCDGVHLMPPGAAAFSERLGREALRPLLEGKLQAQQTGATADGWPAGSE